MTVEELLEHAARLQEDLEHKRRQVQHGTYSPCTKATLARQIEALQARVLDIQQQCAQRTAPESAGLMAAPF
jgi:hypothetical protein